MACGDQASYGVVRQLFARMARQPDFRPWTPPPNTQIRKLLADIMQFESLGGNRLARPMKP